MASEVSARPDLRGSPPLPILTNSETLFVITSLGTWLVVIVVVGVGSVGGGVSS